MRGVWRSAIHRAAAARDSIHLVISARPSSFISAPAGGIQCEIKPERLALTPRRKCALTIAAWHFSSKFFALFERSKGGLAVVGGVGEISISHDGVVGISARISLALAVACRRELGGGCDSMARHSRIAPAEEAWYGGLFDILSERSNLISRLYALKH